MALKNHNVTNQIMKIQQKIMKRYRGIDLKTEEKLMLEFARCLLPVFYCLVAMVLIGHMSRRGGNS